MKVLEIMAWKTEFEVEVPIIDTNSSERMIIEDSDYHLTLDKARSEILRSQMYVNIYEGTRGQVESNMVEEPCL